MFFISVNNNKISRKYSRLKTYRSKHCMKSDKATDMDKSDDFLHEIYGWASVIMSLNSCFSVSENCDICLNLENYNIIIVSEYLLVTQKVIIFRIHIKNVNKVNKRT